MRIKGSFCESGKQDYEAFEKEMEHEEFARECLRIWLSDPNLQGYVSGDEVQQKLFGIEKRGHFVVHQSIFIAGQSRFYVVHMAQGNKEETPLLFIIHDNIKKWRCVRAPEGHSLEGGKTETMVSGYIIDHEEPIWPAAAFFPDKFAELLRFREFLTPEEDNPLTGLITSRTTEVRTLAHQVAKQLKNFYQKWAESILNSL